MRKTILIAALFVAGPVWAQVAWAQTADPFPEPIGAGSTPLVLSLREFATIPDQDGAPPRMMHMVTEPGTSRMFVSVMTGPIYSVSYDGRTVSQYVNLADPRWSVPVQSQGNERGIQSFAFHPQFSQAGSPGFGKFYTWTDVQGMEPVGDFRHLGPEVTHHTVLYEWTAQNPAAAAYDGGPPRDVMRFVQPYSNHNGGQIGFNPLAQAGGADFGLLYVGIGDGGSGGDPQNVAQNLSNGFGKIFRIDPLGRNSPNGKYGIPGDNPFVADNNSSTLAEIYAYGVRNPQRFAWDPQTGNMFLADIGQNVVEELSLVPRGGNLGWNAWEGSFRYVNRQVLEEGQRGDPSITYPVAEYAQPDEILQGQSAATGVQVFRGNSVPQLQNTIVWGDQPSGQLFYIAADPLPSGGQAPIRRILFADGGQTKTLLQLVQEKNASQGREAATRVDMRFGAGPEGQLFLINKRDGVIRQLVPRQ